jgi:4a-hydroxytetrahydrobiopterin dehydratase
MEFREQSCIPCRGGIAPLTLDQATGFAVNVRNWRLPDDAAHLTRDFQFHNYAAALAFVNAISDIAEAEGHHPDIRFGWGYASVTLSTHKIKGLHENDFIMAAKIDHVFANLTAAG